ncbi:thiolase family protein [Aeromicrobium sp. CTD01-1L150]|uniref:thiolase family protein n=1 Tax=Aeromicrobium sp. CTD01-1L150 TaxID=3341830 RepID=UPI0035C12C25
MSLHSPAIVGIGELPPRRSSPGVTTLGMITRAARDAAQDAEIAPSDIDGLVVGVQVGETPQHVAVTVAEFLGLQPSFAEVVDLGGASGAGMIWRADAAIRAGMCTTVLCVLGNSRDPEQQPRATNRNPIREFDVPVGASGANTSYALIAQRYLHEYGRTAADLALVPVVERANAQLNPAAVFHDEPLTVEDVLGSPVVSDPLHLLEIVMPCAGGAAVIVTDGGRSSPGPHRPIRLRGAGELVTHRAVSAAPTLTSSPLRAAMTRAIRQAGVQSSDLQLLSLYDCYSILVLITLEDLGVCAPGQAADWIRDHDVSHTGSTALNTHGGQLACGQADLAGGMGHVIEAVRQLRGDAGPRQMSDVELALVTGNGATMGEEVALVLEAGP